MTFEGCVVDRKQLCMSPFSPSLLLAVVPGPMVRKLVHIAQPFKGSVQGTRVRLPKVVVVWPGDRHEEAGGADAAIVVRNGHHHPERTRPGKMVPEKEL